MRSSRWLLGLLALLVVLPGTAPGVYQPQPDPAEKHIVFVIGEREYRTRYTLPTFAEQHLVPRGFRCTFVYADPDEGNVFPGLEAVQDADLLVLSVRRRTLKSTPFAFLRDYLDDGKPLVALRTTSHAFHRRRGSPPPGHDEWRTFDIDVLGARYDGHYANDLLPTIKASPEAEGHPLLTGVRASSFVSGGSLYRSRELASTTQVVLEGHVVEDGETRTEPVAWTNVRGRQHIFYTSLGHPVDFEQASFRQLLVNAVYWALGEEPASPDLFGDFFEPDFPFITTTVDAGNLGPASPEKNLTIRGVVMRLGNDAYALFDTDLLRMSAGWLGDKLALAGMPAISYHRALNKKNDISTLKTAPIFATGIYPGWMGANPIFRDPRPAGPNPDEVGRGPIAESLGRWNGLYVVGDQVVLSYTVLGAPIFEQPGSIRIDGETALARTFKIGAATQPLTLVLDEIVDGATTTVEGQTARVYHRSEKEVVTAVGLVDAPAEMALQVLEDRYLTLTIPAGTPASLFKVVVWKGEVARQDRFARMLSTPVEMANPGGGGPTRWPGTVTTQGLVAPDTAAYVVDELPLPLPNPWRRNVRVAGVDFFEDGRAALVTFDGDIWLVSGIDEALQHLQWKRFASGLYESMSLQIVTGQIYVFGRDQITRLHDLNNDDEADFYENFSNLAVQTVESREFPLDLVKKPGGGFYLGIGAATNAGPKTSRSIMKGFRAGGVHSGTVLEVAPDGRSVRVFASGFRQPYLGVHPETGLVTASDQQGTFVPSTPIYAVREGGFYGVPATAHTTATPAITPPLTWIPHQVDPSGAGQVWAATERMGLLNGALLHLSYGEPAAFRIFIDDKAEGPVQGGLVRIPASFGAPLLKGAIHPRDGQLYVAGFQVWGSKAEKISGFSRLRYTGLPSMLPVGMQTGTQGIFLRFDQVLDAEAATDVANYRVKRWNYQRTPEYGSGHFKMDGTPGEDALAVAGAYLAPDNKALLLVIPGLQEVMQMSVAYDLLSSDGHAVQHSLYLTIHTLQPLDLLAEGFGDLNVDLAALQPTASTAPSPQTSVERASVERGARLHTQYGCIACHSADGVLEGKLGPTFKDLYGAVRPLEDGTEVMADEAYLRESILKPAVKIVEGYEVAMASYQGVLSEAEVTSLVLFIKSLSE